jgi:bacterioferritin (cytochrome b1)
VVTEPTDAEPASRRRLLSAAGAGLAGAAATLLVTGCGQAAKPLPEQKLSPTSPAASADIDVLNHLLDLEHVAISAYTAGTPLLVPDVTKAGSLFLNDELGHAGQLIGLIKQAGGLPNKPAPSYDLGHPQTSKDVLELLHELERQQLAAYLEAIPQLAPGMVRQQVVAVMANDAQHVSVLRASLGLSPVPSALVTGRE